MFSPRKVEKQQSHGKYFPVSVSQRSYSGQIDLEVRVSKCEKEQVVCGKVGGYCVQIGNNLWGLHKLSTIVI